MAASAPPATQASMSPPRDAAERFADRVRARGAGARVRHARSLEPVSHRHLSGARFEMVAGMKYGVMRFGPFSARIRLVFSIDARPPIPTPT